MFFSVVHEKINNLFESIPGFLYKDGDDLMPIKS